ncbi:hypothetical protein Mzhil_0299 [Methanosalsum zhilinae DSM 4017]|uniref:Uncharacterized protein n=1 Tax=Methanosalsum zhilinae (strain DSM 4017 / NBRC 107636 / OCM 62 / WeN5) TaxID=679901 RepID=F7XNY5_METZD|nr:hypothetical protein Mzhil_0299 [Methanosalsum zhilinae DSM 4017]
MVSSFVIVKLSVFPRSHNTYNTFYEIDFLNNNMNESFITFIRKTDK